MGHCHWHLFLIFIVLIPVGTLGLSPEGHSLLALAKNLVLPTSINSTWNPSDRTPCNWVGIECDGDHVVTLNISLSGTSGTLGPAVGHLTHLHTFDLSINSISGGIPPELGNCTHLHHLDLSTNLFSGHIPNTLHNLHSLYYLSAYSNFLSGDIPDSLFNIPYLDTVYLNQNNLTGQVPPTIGNMSRVRILWLADNLLSGSLPDSLGNLTNLEELFLFHNHLSGQFPETLNNIKGIAYIDITKNSLSGRIPLVPTSCKNLIQLLFSYNLFEGEIPSGIGNCTSLTTINAVNNRLSGKIPSSIGLLSGLSALLLSQNSFSGSIPPEIGKCGLLTMFEAYENQLEGSIPRELGNLGKLQSLALFSNNLIGEIPVEVWRLQQLESVLLYDNILSGELPLDMAELRNLRNVSLFDNRFTGVIPQGLGINSSLEQIDFINNSFTGEIPPNICHGKRLRILNLAYNLLVGSVPLGVGKCSTLARMILSNNNLTGSLPEFTTNASLYYMDISLNNLNGHIPRSLGNCGNLRMVDLSGNNLSGPVIQEIGNLVNLHVLKLSHNNLYGHLPSEFSFCTKLYLLDLGFNNLNGSISSSLTNLTLLSGLILQDNKFTGGIPEFLGEFDQLLELQLGGNNFGGAIPSSLGMLQNLATALNLSSNGLIGKVPSAFRSLNKLESLDLSVNSLSGNLTFLDDLSSLLNVNVSHNNFTGRVPEKWISFLKAMPSSFMGNPGLCIPCQGGDSSCTKTGILKPCIASNDSKRPNKTRIVAIALSMLVLFVLVCLVFGFILFRCKTNEEEPSLPDDGSSVLLTKVLEATENLNEKYTLGRGAHGTVYKASLSQDKVYAVKKLVFAGQRRSNLSMLREIKTVGKIRHRNLVKLVNFWSRSKYGLILYDYMENGSLYDVLHEIKPQPVLKWNVRFKIALGTAQGIAYLHDDCNPSIIHCDIKPENILLDSEMEPHISDFGIAKLVDQTTGSSESTAIMGTAGYISPETAFTTRKIKESDVYSYGVVLLELITRRKALDSSFPENTDIVSWVSSTLDSSGEIDLVAEPGLIDEVMGSVEMEEVYEMLSLALTCTAKEPRMRPSMKNVVKKLIDMKSIVDSAIKQGKSKSPGY